MPPKEDLLLLHLSDIHFEEPFCLDQGTDHDHPVRKAIINDIKVMVTSLGPVDAILVSGDIAHKGNVKEYEFAKIWLREVAAAAQCPETEIYTVPGNHDVCRKTASERAVNAFRLTIQGKEAGGKRDKELNKALREEECCHALYRPMEEYNNFAAGYGCDLVLSRPFWVTEKYISPGWNLAIHGLSSTLFSGPENDDPRKNLYLGALQHSFSPDDGTIRLAMLHHPPEWLEDYDKVDEALTEGCQIVLLGHKHRQRHTYDKRSIRLAAGAVNPARTEGNWEPGYNFVKLQIVETAKGHSLKVDAYQRTWQGNPDRFIPRKTVDDEEVFSDLITLYRQPSYKSESCGSCLDLSLGSNSSPLEVPVQKLTQRELMLKFWDLSTSQRWEVVNHLGLLDTGDARLPENVRYRKAIEKAHAEYKIAELCDLIELKLKDR